MREAFKKQCHHLSMADGESARRGNKAIVPFSALVCHGRVLPGCRNNVVQVVAYIDGRLSTLREECERAVVSDSKDERLLAAFAAKRRQCLPKRHREVLKQIVAIGGGACVARGGPFQGTCVVAEDALKNTTSNCARHRYLAGHTSIVRPSAETLHAIETSPATARNPVILRGQRDRCTGGARR